MNSTPTSSSPHWESSLSPIRRYFSTLWQILTQPTLFFKSLSITGGLSGPLAFALITHWIGSALQFLWHGWIGNTLSSYFSSVFKVSGDVIEIDHPGRAAQLMQLREQLTHWLWGTGAVIADPFITLIAVLFTSLLVFVGARIFVTTKPGRAVTFESAVRIICFGMAPAILAGLPLLGGFVAAFLTAIVTIIAAREVYEVGNLRATAIALFPKLLFIFVLLTGLLFFAVALVKLVTVMMS